MENSNQKKAKFASAVVLSKAEMKQVTGGQLTCYCSSGLGFSPNPSLSTIELVGMIDDYCGSGGGSCYTVFN